MLQTKPKQVEGGVMLSSWLDPLPVVDPVERRERKPRVSRRVPGKLGEPYRCETCGKLASRRTLIRARYCCEACVKPLPPPPPPPLTFGLDVLRTLRRSGTAELCELAKHIGCAPSKAADALQRLERRGLVVREGGQWRAA